MVASEKIRAFCEKFLDVGAVHDPWCKNGIQVVGKPSLQKIALGTTASRNFLHMSASWGADAVIVHHGLFWGKGVLSLEKELCDRLKILLENNISLFAYHLPLDAHKDVGNNVQIAKRIGLENIRMHDICVVGDLPEKVGFSKFQKECECIFGQSVCFAHPFLQDSVACVGICSGGGAEYARILRSENIDTFLTGEIAEKDYHMFLEMPLNVLACGHHATERFGIQALGDVLEKEFPEIQTFFFHESCPV
jgi:dinuclear metal center YbgI/SA1388 family protein